MTRPLTAYAYRDPYAHAPELARLVFITDPSEAPAGVEVVKLVEERGWMPIETAPKDGTKFLTWTKGCGGCVVVENDPDDPMPTHIVPSGHQLMVDDGKTLHALRGEYPTHWQPLPPPPTKDTK
jgi:hypothetical protein